MVGTDSLYRGSNDGFDAEKGTDFVGYHVPSGGFSMSTMPMTANQIKEVTGRINMGLKSVEMGVIQPKVMDAIPDSHLEEINRLSKLTGVDMTFHAPLVEPTGFSQNKGRWSELDRKQSEMQILNSIERSHKVKPDGNIIVTMHASQEFPMPETKVKTRRPDGSFEEKTQNIAVMDPFSGQIGSIPTIEKDYFKKDGGEISPQEVIDDMNKRAWTDELSSVIRTKSIAAQENRQVRELTKDKKFAEDPYTAYKRDPKETQNIINNFKNSNEVNDKETAHVMKMIIDSDRDKDMMMRNVYAHFKQMYNWAMDDAQRTDQKEEVNRLREFTKEARPLIEKYEKGEASLDAFSEQLDKGLDILSTLKKNPSKYIEAKEFAINKSAETFSNVALESYKKFGNTAPILSIENGPVGMGISTGENLKKLVDETRKKFVDNAQKSKDEGGLNMSKSSAEEQAEKLIGVTWDLGHIN
ncbi:MAG: hypothetical protein WCK90_04355, partial [archaeon]